MSDESENSSKSTKQGNRSPLVVVAVLIAIAILGVLAYNAFKSDPQASNSSSSNSSSNIVDQPIAGAQGVYISPQSANHANGSTFTVQIRENSSQTPVNAVQANLTYPVDMLKVRKVNPSCSKFKVQAQNQTGAGKIELARGSASSLTGDQIVTQIPFQAIAPGSAKLVFAEGTALIDPTTTKNIMTSLP